ncbi:MAG: SDR family NAD(P)-dependent oxidoreductase, partial [Erysipelotrichaceae bacterium]|nr:SDR family NAD(P)-dependent oxidoreductase [Erysipelotrichaceae bacterium]
VYEFSRSGKEREDIRHLDCDVTETEDIIKAVNKVIADTGRVDLVVNCAGFGISGAIEYTDLDDAKRQFDVNFFGLAEVNRICIPYLKKTKGRIINISSVAALASIPFQAYYSACKAAVNSYTLALANELKPFGVSVCAIMPGDTSTGFTKARNKNIKGDGEYGGRISKSVEKMENDERKGVDADVVGRLICAIAKKKKIKPIYTVGWDYKLIICLLKILPYNLSNYLIAKLYG